MRPVRLDLFSGSLSAPAQGSTCSASSTARGSGLRLVGVPDGWGQSAASDAPCGQRRSGSLPAGGGGRHANVEGTPVRGDGDLGHDRASRCASSSVERANAGDAAEPAHSTSPAAAQLQASIAAVRREQEAVRQRCDAAEETLKARSRAMRLERDRMLRQEVMVEQQQQQQQQQQQHHQLGLQGALQRPSPLACADAEDDLDMTLLRAERLLAAASPRGPRGSPSGVTWQGASPLGLRGGLEAFGLETAHQGRSPRGPRTGRQPVPSQQLQGDLRLAEAQARVEAAYWRGSLSASEEPASLSPLEPPLSPP